MIGSSLPFSLREIGADKDGSCADVTIQLGETPRSLALASSLPSQVALSVFIAPIPILAIFIAIKLDFPGYYHAIIQDDDVLENLQFVLYASASIPAYLAARRFRLLGMRYRAAIWYVFAVATLAIAFEEVSWFERVTHFHIDQVVSRNLQKETNLHNLDFVQPYLLPRSYIVVGAVGAFGWVLLRNSLIVPEKILFFYFLPTLLLYSYFFFHRDLAGFFNNEQFAVGTFIVWRDQEPVETLLSLGFFLHAYLISWYLKITGETSNRSPPLSRGP